MDCRCVEEKNCKEQRNKKNNTMGLKKSEKYGKKISNKNTRHTSKIKQPLIQSVNRHRKLQQNPLPVESMRVFCIWIGIPPLESNNAKANATLMRSK